MTQHRKFRDERLASLKRNAEARADREEARQEARQDATPDDGQSVAERPSPDRIPDDVGDDDLRHLRTPPRFGTAHYGNFEDNR